MNWSFHWRVNPCEPVIYVGMWSLKCPPGFNPARRGGTPAAWLTTSRNDDLLLFDVQCVIPTNFIINHKPHLCSANHWSISTIEISIISLSRGLQDKLFEFIKEIEMNLPFKWPRCLSSRCIVAKIAKEYSCLFILDCSFLSTLWPYDSSNQNPSSSTITFEWK